MGVWVAVGVATGLMFFAVAGGAQWIAIGAAIGAAFGAAAEQRKRN